jgi:hypothetical protein
MYIHTSDGLGRPTTPAPAAPPKPSAADARVLAQAAKLAKAIDTAIREIGQSMKFLATSAQKDLLSEIVAILGTYFPTGYGVIDSAGKVIKSSARYRTEVSPKSPPRGAPFYFHHDTWLLLSYQISGSAGRQRPFAPGHRNWIYLCAANLSSDAATLAMVLIHETVHMLGHRYRSIEEKFGAKIASETPTKAAGALLNRSAFDPLRRVMEQHFLTLVDLLNRQPHRAQGGSFAQVPRTIATTWSVHVVEEVLAFVFTERATWALAQYQASKTRIGLSQKLVPMQFLKTYFRNYWLSDPKDRAALKTKEADQVFGTMETDLLKLVDAVRKHIGT